MSKRSLRLLFLSLAGLVLVLLVPSTACAQLNSTAQSVSLTATMSETLTISATPSSVTFALVPNGVAAGSAAIQVTTTWVLAAGRANVVLDAYFASASAALSYAGSPVVNIPTSAVLGQVLTGTPTTFTAFTGSPALGTSGAGLTLFTQALTSSNRESNRTDNLSLEISTTSLQQLPAATYTGTLTLQAQAL